MAGRCTSLMVYFVGVVVLMGAGALIGAVCVYFFAPMKPTVVHGIQEVRHAVCVFSGGNIYGNIHLTEIGDNPDNNLNITASITGIPGGLHGFHIHSWGVPADGDCKKCGGHYNPKGHVHGGPQDSERHVGDLGNINVTSPVTEIEILDQEATLWGSDSIVGRSFVIHAGEDDLGTKDDPESQKTGNAGARLACCTIYLVEA
ncbi:superoxide dismutase [Cu-Zn]-like [Palaemon carinicauda]|uniref:superoxide dismutase [Cu-Zn]-like n=1 Tax=Palaemon carinicauda TaxID=392227 RepID=UPI0035B69AE3